MISNTQLVIIVVVVFLYLSAQIDDELNTTHPPTPAPPPSPPRPPLHSSPWIIPTALPPLPECIFLQDPAVFEKPLSQCTRRLCNRHFGIFCTRHTYLVETSCLTTSFTPEILTPYLDRRQCSRSLLARAQVSAWLQEVTGRDWFVSTGDAWDVQPGHLIGELGKKGGFGGVEVQELAPPCLTGTWSADGEVGFDTVMQECEFSARKRYVGGQTGRAAWEYNPRTGEMSVAGYDTVGFNDLVAGGDIVSGEYFEKGCFCEGFAGVVEEEARGVCQRRGIEFTKASLWMGTMCRGTGARYDDGNWTEGIRVLPSFDYIAAEKWKLPRSGSYLPEQVKCSLNSCKTDACEINPEGYCGSVNPVVDRSCVCRNLNYHDTCKGPCLKLGNRIEYVNWLHNLCGAVQGWNGLPEHWREELATPLRKEIIPWDWTVTSSYRSSKSPGKSSSEARCESMNWILGGFLLINILTLPFGIFLNRVNAEKHAKSKTVLTSIHHHLNSYPMSPWILASLAIFGLNLAANFINAILVKTTPGYENVPLLQLTLLWCTIPRYAWITLVLQKTMQNSRSHTLETGSAFLLAEVVLQALAAIYIFGTVEYGVAHGFYNSSMARLAGESGARYMYVSALVWVVVAVVMVGCLLALWVVQRHVTFSTRKTNDETETFSLLESQMGGKGYGTTSNSASDTVAAGSTTAVPGVEDITFLGMMLYSSAQTWFWFGFVELAREEFCPPRIGMMIAVWGAASMGGAVLARGMKE